MKKLDSNHMAWTKALLAGLSIAGCCVAAATPADGTGPAPVSVGQEFPGHTAPIEKRDQNFDLPGVVSKLMVKEGDVVKAGQLIAQQDISADEAHLKSVEMVANSSLEVRAEEAQLAKDKVDLSRKEELIKQSAIAPSEYEEAKLAVTIDQLKVDHAREDQQKAKYDVAEQKAKIQQKQMYARIDGVVSQISTHEGELAETQHPAVTLVKNDPLYVEVDLPADLVTRLIALPARPTLQVRYVDEADKNAWHEAKIHFIKPEADPQSNFEHVQLEMPNPHARSSGLQVVVRVPDGLPAAGGSAARVSESR